eukprot:1938035-Amphidinium_carterae.1
MTSEEIATKPTNTHFLRAISEQERENIEIRLREMRAQKAEERRTALDSIEEVFVSLQSGAKILYEDKTKATRSLFRE